VFRLSTFSFPTLSIDCISKEAAREVLEPPGLEEKSLHLTLIEPEAVRTLELTLYLKQREVCPPSF
jgi:hypothetical protein